MAPDSDKGSTRTADDLKKEGREGAERAGEALQELGSRVGRGLAAAAARVREEAEDIWAEAQSIRRGERD